ncbi:MAG: bilirubin oxidase, partial [Acidimicrobiia bacterium]
MRVSRRTFVKLAGAGVAVLYVQGATGGLFEVARAQIPGGTLAPGDVDKFVLPLVKPPAMPPSKTLNKGDLYKIAVRQFSQRVLSPPHPETMVWGYGSVDFPGTVAQGGT